MFRKKEASTGFVPSEQLGKISRLPGLGRRFITLWMFEREGLQPLYRRSPKESNMFTNRHLDGIHRHGWVPPNQKCDGCGRTFADLCGGQDPRQKPKEHELIMLVPHTGDVTAYFCWDCGASRDAMISACGSKFSKHIAEDGQDVFALVSQIVKEDRLSDQPGYEPLACHNNLRIHPDYRNQIDGRLKTLQRRMK